MRQGGMRRARLISTRSASGVVSEDSVVVICTLGVYSSLPITVLPFPSIADAAANAKAHDVGGSLFLSHSAV